ncbi:uncharacterized protein PGTG_12100 [Puccinia graminis f. sp. tritici CRL 75-36-700-3]|uniref:Uncharacterized protein n=1 Tax=Puccinia graminis f. sp. tritici (strain CRL 75-36-700-3 / race SCCL) TaxID=418459 RepID=E3KPB9_PUCGT|nr:uncharacterized protein PGTG_12100 [Puccinia graminis f. sp. tritici CRL 75-36-700-3]EFP86144.2 hypothetical protein PGTG_12100 [Puccinia graminis f. sp. tritici CRL 75-36-700-3]
MKFLVLVTTTLLPLIPGVVYGVDFDGWCASHYGNVGKPWAICGKAEYVNDDPKQGISRWSVRPQDKCKLLKDDPTAIPFCCAKSIHKIVNSHVWAHSGTAVDPVMIKEDCHKLA